MVNVLVVDDDTVSCTALRYFLEESGFEVRAAQDGPSALEAVRSFRPDVLLSDWRLPGDGDASYVAREIRSLHPEVEVILLTGFSPDDVRASLGDLPVRNILSKPAPFPDVERAIRNVLGGATEELHPLQSGLKEGSQRGSRT